MKMKLLILSLIAAANVFVAIRFRQPMGFVIAGAVAVVLPRLLAAVLHPRRASGADRAAGFAGLSAEAALIYHREPGCRLTSGFLV